MFADRYACALSIASAATQDAYGQEGNLALTVNPCTTEDLERAVATDAGFAPAYAGSPLHKT